MRSETKTAEFEKAEVDYKTAVAACDEAEVVLDEAKVAYDKTINKEVLRALRAVSSEVHVATLSAYYEVWEAFSTARSVWNEKQRDLDKALDIYKKTWAKMKKEEKNEN